MLLVTQGWGLLPSQYFQTSCSPLLPPVLPFIVCMFLNWQSRQVTLKTSSQNMYWGKRMVESLFFFIYLFYNNSTRWAETDRTEGWWFSGLLLLSTGKHGKHLVVLSTLWNPLIPLWENPWFSLGFSSPALEAWLGCLKRTSNPRTGWSSRMNWGSFSLNISLETSLPLLFLLLHGIILLPYHWINQLCLKAWKHHVFLFSI